MYVILVLFTVASCDSEKVEKIDKAKIEDLPYSEKVEYAKTHLFSIGEKLLKESGNTNLKDIIYSEAQKKFDGSHNVLIQTLIEKHKNLNSGELRKSLDAFNQLDGHDWHPQIYIPFYEDLKEKNLIGKLHPTLIIVPTDEGKVEYEGYRLLLPNSDANNSPVKIEKMDKLVDESYAKENETWVISLSESYVDNTLKPFSSQDSKNKRVMGPVGSNCYGNAKVNGVITYLQVNCHKEAWTAGASEVNITQFSMFDDPSKGPWWVNNPERSVIDNIDRVYISNHTFYPNWPIYPGWDPINGNSTGAKGDQLIFAIFEFDSWPTGIRTETLMTYPTSNFPSRPVALSFRSNDGSYLAGPIFKDWPEGGLGNSIYNLVDICRFDGTTDCMKMKTAATLAE